jgi:release factor glutamine methyltransferase
MTIEQLYKEYISQLKNIYDEREAANITDWVFENIAGLKKIDRTLGKQNELSTTIASQLHDALKELLQYKPVQYVLREAWFYKMKLFVNENVLIPRPETEELVEWVVQDVRNTKYNVLSKKTSPSLTEPHALNIIDIGTGSGCIAIALKKELDKANIIGVDVSTEVLSVAKQNAASQHVNIDLIQADFLNERSWSDLSRFDIIVSNPPYIPGKEKDILDKNVVAHEPHSALFVNDNDPFIFYKKISTFALGHLESNGKIYVEVHEKYASEVAAIFLKHHWTPTIKKDIYGRERMICAER